MPAKLNSVNSKPARNRRKHPDAYRNRVLHVRLTSDERIRLGAWSRREGRSMASLLIDAIPAGDVLPRPAEPAHRNAARRPRPISTLQRIRQQLAVGHDRWHPQTD